MHDESELPPWRWPLTLTMTERLTLANQFQILSQLNEANASEAKRFLKLREIVAEGYTDFYHEVFGAVNGELPLQLQRELNRILMMFDSIYDSLKELGITGESESFADTQFGLEFQGFHLNDHLEYRLDAYMRFMFSRGNWSALREWIESLPNDGNSLTLRLPQYREMLSRYEEIHEEFSSRVHLPMIERYKLNEADLIRLAGSL